MSKSRRKSVKRVKRTAAKAARKRPPIRGSVKSLFFDRRRSLGRLFRPDPRDHGHLIEAFLPKRLPPIRRRRWAYGPAAWDQGQTSRCVAFGSNRLLVAAPVANQIWFPPRPGLVDAEPLTRTASFESRIDNFYDAIRRVDGFQPPNHDGSTVRAAFKVLQAAGYISGYRWAFEPVAVAQHLLTVGPVVAGVDWTEPMFSPTNYGKAKGTFVKVSEGDGSYRPIGGHCVALVAVDLDGWCPDGSTGWAEFVNSWDTTWGDKGRARISLKDLGVLASNSGEFGAPVEVTIPRMPRVKYPKTGGGGTDITGTV